MEELLHYLQIDTNLPNEQILEELKKKQVEFSERLDNVDDEKRKEKLERDLKDIETTISALSWSTGKQVTGIERDGEDFSDLKGGSDEKSLDRVSAPQTADAGSGNASGSDLENEYDKALEMLATPDYQKGIEALEKLAESGYDEALCELGRLYHNGNRVPEDKAKAFDYFQKAAMQGNAQAMGSCGICLVWGYGVPEDKAKAVEWFRKAAEAGDACSMYNLSTAFMNGEGVPKDETKAFEWTTKAAEAGVTDAFNNMGWCYEHGIGTFVDIGKAKDWYLKAANAGDPTGMFNIGECYREGKGIDPNCFQKCKWYLKAAKLGQPSAKEYLLKCIQYQADGSWNQDIAGIYLNDQDVYDWMREEADNGDPWICRLFGYVLCYKGVFDRDCNKAIKYLEQSKQYEDTDARWADTQIGIAYDCMGQYDKGKEYYLRASGQGFAFASTRLAENCGAGNYGLTWRLKRAYYEDLARRQNGN